MPFAYFPTPLPDELLYSVCARFADHMQYPTTSNVLEELLGTNQAYPIIDLPTRIEYLVTKLPLGAPYSADDFIEQHTMFPFYAPFLSPNEVVSLKEDMLTGDGRGIHAQILALPHLMPIPLQMQFCPVCATEDKKQYVECYWHRTHQLPAVKICPVHNVWLESSPVVTRGDKKQKAFISAERTLQQLTPRFIEKDIPILSKLAQDAIWVLQNPHHTTGEISLYKRFVNRFVERGFVTTYGKVKPEVLQKAFDHYFAQEVPEFLEADIVKLRKGLLDLLRFLRKRLSPVSCLLLMQFLDYTAETFFEPITDSELWEQLPLLV